MFGNLIALQGPLLQLLKHLRFSPDQNVRIDAEEVQGGKQKLKQNGCHVALLWPCSLGGGAAISACTVMGESVCVLQGLGGWERLLPRRSAAAAIWGADCSPVHQLLGWHLPFTRSLFFH